MRKNFGLQYSLNNITAICRFKTKKASHRAGGAHCQTRLLPLFRLPTTRTSVWRRGTVDDVEDWMLL
jgi:hypothetical protein